VLITTTGSVEGMQIMEYKGLVTVPDTAVLVEAG